MNSAACDGKTAYTSFTKAEKAVAGLRRKTSAHARAYPCRRCGGFHIGNHIGVAHLDARLRRATLDRIERRERRMAWV